MRDRTQDALPKSHLDVHDLGAPRRQHDRAAIEARHPPAVELPEQVGQVHRHEIDERRRSTHGLAFGEGATLSDGIGGQRHVAVSRGGQRARVRGEILGRLLRQCLVHLLAAALDRMGGADVCARSHRGDVGGNREQKAGRRRTCSRRRHENRDRRPSGDHPGDDGARGVDEATWRAQRKDDKRGAGRVGAVDGVDHVVGGDRMDDAVDDGGEHNRPALAFARGVLASERGLNCQRQAEGQEQKRD